MLRSTRECQGVLRSLRECQQCPVNQGVPGSGGMRHRVPGSVFKNKGMLGSARECGARPGCVEESQIKLDSAKKCQRVYEVPRSS